jgi:hypothetical protein
MLMIAKEFSVYILTRENPRNVNLFLFCLVFVLTINTQANWYYLCMPVIRNLVFTITNFWIWTTKCLPFVLSTQTLFSYKFVKWCRKIVSQNWFRENIFGFSPVLDSISTDRTWSVDIFSTDFSAVWSEPSLNLSDQRLVVRQRPYEAPLMTSRFHV